MPVRVSVLNGPPFASGLVHVGTAANQVVKDVWTRMTGGKLPLLIDAQGLPIQHAARKRSTIDPHHPLWIAECLSVADYNIARMKEDLQALGCRYEKVMDTTNLDFKVFEMDLLRSLWQRGVLYPALLAVDYCPSCDTTLAKSQVQTRSLPSTTYLLAFPLRGMDASLLVATTQPETVVNVKMFVRGFARYGLYRWEGANYVCCHPLPGMELIRLVEDHELVEVDCRGEWQRILPCEAVHTTESPTGRILTDVGVVMLAPAHAPTDYRLCSDLYPKTVQDLQHSWREHRARYLEELKAKTYQKNLVSIHETTQDRPACWRCDSRPASILQEEWYIRTSLIRDRLVAFLEKLLSENRMNGSRQLAERTLKWWSSPVDWVISRNRAYQTPLPLARCINAACPHQGEVQGFYTPRSCLRERADAYYPRIEALAHKDARNTCSCGKPLRMLGIGVSVWFDSAILPLYQNHHARMVVEGKDQAQAWFYYISVMALLMDREPPFDILSYTGWVLDKEGGKMSKRSTDTTGETLIKRLVSTYGVARIRSYLLSLVSARDFIFDEAILFQERKFVNVYHNIKKYHQLAFKGLERPVSGYTSPLELLEKKALQTGDLRSFWLKVKHYALQQVSRTLINRHKTHAMTPEQQAITAWQLHTVLRLMKPILEPD